jgi:hypothetical protein
MAICNKIHFNDMRNDSFGDSISINGGVVVVTAKNEAALYLGYSVNANNFFNSFFARKNGPSPLYSIVVFEEKKICAAPLRGTVHIFSSRVFLN